MYLKVDPKSDADFTEFILEYHKNPILQKFEIKIIEDHHLIEREKIKELLIEKGQTALLSQDLLLEHLVIKGTPQNTIIKILQQYLDKVDIDKELIIVDPYFYPSRHSASYSQFIVDTLKKYLPNIDEIKVVTGTRCNNTIKNQIKNDLETVKPGLIISNTQSDDYHDRYWISNNREKGVIIGTSMNGLGNKYALIDRLNITDVRHIISELKTSGLV
jgi:hypothetical protein